MAIVSINPVQRREKKDTLDRIAQGLDIAQSVLGISLAVPEYLQKRKAAGLEEKKTTAETKLIEAKTAQEKEDSVLLTPQQQEEFVTTYKIPAFLAPKTVGDAKRMLITPAQQTSIGFQQEGIDLRKQEIADRKAKEAADKAAKEAGLLREKQEKTIEVLGHEFATAQDKKDVQGSLDGWANARKALDDLISDREEGGGSLNPTTRSLGKQKATDILLQLKEINKLGILSASDEKLLNELMPKDPFEFAQSTMLGFDDPILAKMKNMREIINNKVMTGIRTRGLELTPERMKTLEKFYKMNQKRKAPSMQKAIDF